MENICPKQSSLNENPILRTTDTGSIKSELGKIERELRSKNISPEVYRQLYAAQQASAWVLNANAAASSQGVILAGKVQAITGTPAN